MDINLSCMAIRASCPEHGRVDLDWDTHQPHKGNPPEYPDNVSRRAEIEAGISNLAQWNIIVFDASGDPSAIDPDDELKSLLRFPQSVGWRLKTITGVNDVEHVTEYTFVVDHGDLKVVQNGPAPFIFIRVAGMLPESAERTHGDVSHFVFDGTQRGRFWPQQWRITHDGVRHESAYYGPEKGYAFGSQT